MLDVEVEYRFLSAELSNGWTLPRAPAPPMDGSWPCDLDFWTRDDDFERPLKPAPMLTLPGRFPPLRPSPTLARVLVPPFTIAFRDELRAGATGVYIESRYPIEPVLPVLSRLGRRAGGTITRAYSWSDPELDRRDASNPAGVDPMGVRRGSVALAPIATVGNEVMDLRGVTNPVLPKDMFSSRVYMDDRVGPVNAPEDPEEDERPCS